MSDDGLNLLRDLDYSVLQQCMHCGMCLPTCPTYDATLHERSSPRGRIAMMRAIADGELEASTTFAEEMYFCLGCLACQTACPAGVDYAALFENARAEVERQGLLDGAVRNFVRRWILGWLFAKQTRLRAVARLLRAFQRSGLRTLARRSGLLKLLPFGLGDLEPLAPQISPRFTDQLYRQSLQQTNPPTPRYRVALLAGCVQDISFAEVNADTICVLQHNGCQVLLPEAQACCGSLHAHNGAVEQAQQQARLNIDAFDAENLDAIVVNAGGCGLHCKHYDRLLADDPTYAERAAAWSAKVKDVHELARRHRLAPAPRRNAPTTGRLPRVVPPQARAAGFRSPARGAPSRAQSGTRTAGRGRLVLRQRRHLQHHPTRAVHAATRPQDGARMRDRRDRSSHGQHGLRHPTPIRRPPRTSRRGRRPPRVAFSRSLSR